MDVGVFWKGNLDQGGVLFLAEHDTDGVVLRLRSDVPIEVVDLHLHLAEVLMRELANLEVDEYIGPQQPVIKHEIDEEMFFVESEPPLP